MSSEIISFVSFIYNHSARFYYEELDVVHLRCILLNRAIAIARCGSHDANLVASALSAQGQFTTSFGNEHAIVFLITNLLSFLQVS